MKLQRVVGLFVVAISILTLSLQISIAYLSKYIDQTTGEFWSKGYEYKYIPNSVFVFFIIAMGIGAYLIFKGDDNNLI